MITPDDVIIQILEDNNYVLEEASKLPKVGPQFTKPGMFANLDRDHWIKTDNDITKCVVYWVWGNIIELFMDVMQAEHPQTKPTQFTTMKRVSYKASKWNLADPNSLESMVEFINQKLR